MGNTARSGTVRRGRATAPALRKVRPAERSVFSDLGFAPELARNLALRSQLMIALDRLMCERGLTQVKAAALFGVSQPRVSDLKRGKIEKFSLDMLVEMLTTAGATVDMTVRRAPAPRAAGTR